MVVIKKNRKRLLFDSSPLPFYCFSLLHVSSIFSFKMMWDSDVLYTKLVWLKPWNGRIKFQVFRRIVEYLSFCFQIKWMCFWNRTLGDIKYLALCQWELTKIFFSAYNLVLSSGLKLLPRACGQLVIFTSVISRLQFHLHCFFFLWLYRLCCYMP